MSSEDFREITIGTESEKADRLFRAAVSAFCSLARPSRREIVQLEDLVLPLFGSVSVESKRYVAAALSECETAPAALVWRLCNQPVDIAAPLLIRSPALSDVDLVTLIGRFGMSHARVIARRPGLAKPISDLIRALARSSSSLQLLGEPAMPMQSPPLAEAASGAKPVTSPNAAAGQAAESAENPSLADDTRQRLRALMRPTDEKTVRPATGYNALRFAALTGSLALLRTAIADSLQINPRDLRAAVADSDQLLLALRALDLSAEEAFLLAACIFPGSFGTLRAIRAFLDTYRGLSAADARARLLPAAREALKA